MRKVNIIKTKRNENGITLVALVVTIVVLLILAGITISTLFGDNGIISAARKAADETKNAVNDTDKALNNLNNYLNSQLNGTVEPKNIEDWEYELDEETNTITITKYKGKDTEVVIPNSIGGVKVVQVGIFRGHPGDSPSVWDDSITTKNRGAYLYTQETIKSIIIPEGIETIGSLCFADSINLQKISLPNSLRNIEERAFLGCRSLENIKIPSNVTYIGYGALDTRKPVEPKNIEDWEYTVNTDANTITITRYKGKDTEVIIPNSIGGVRVTQVGKNIDHNSHDSILWDSSIRTNNMGVYDYKQETISSIIVSEGIETIGKNCFTDAVNLQSIKLPTSIVTIKNNLFLGCTSLKNVIIPDSVNSVEGWAFGHCTSLTNITIPSSVINMGENVFGGIPTITVTVPFKRGNKPSGWNDSWNSTSTGCTVDIIYQQ